MPQVTRTASDRLDVLVAQCDLQADDGCLASHGARRSGHLAQRLACGVGFVEVEPGSRLDHREQILARLGQLRPVGPPHVSDQTKRYAAIVEALSCLRGFVADRATTRASFLHAFWLSTLCILGFGLFGVQASLAGAAYEGELIGTWAALFPAPVFALLMLSLLISALSTLDSALSSAARLTVEELRLAPRSLWGGRLATRG